MLIPPYLYTSKLGDAWFELNLQLLQQSVSYLEREGLDLPVVPVFAAALHEYGPQGTWRAGLDRYLATASRLDVRLVALSWSWSDPGRASYASLAHLLTATRHASLSTPVLGWRQGLYGLPLVAVGAAGYETGAGQGEGCHYPRFAASRRPRPVTGESGPRGGAAIYFSTFGRSVPRRAGKVLLANPQLRGSLVCTDESLCCPDGADSMIGQWREHAVRARARELQELAAMPPSRRWRLNHVARHAERALAAVRLSNCMLRGQGATLQLPEGTYRGLARVADEIRSHPDEQVA